MSNETAGDLPADMSSSIMLLYVHRDHKDD